MFSHANHFARLGHARSQPAVLSPVEGLDPARVPE